ncbi:hypothetical protein D5086_028253 [Populus alba]|uniref:Uncharacterized protein n=2 Tax=Populus TaxID=3689 RepID=A0ACC4AXM3_POPAL|nr:hypothetical protein NC653_034839 [Populus alba x Populus x berolinensis]
MAEVWTVLPGAGIPSACPKVFPVFKVVMGCHGVLKLCYRLPSPQARHGSRQLERAACDLTTNSETTGY